MSPTNQSKKAPHGMGSLRDKEVAAQLCRYATEMQRRGKSPVARVTTDNQLIDAVHERAIEPSEIFKSDSLSEIGEHDAIQSALDDDEHLKSGGALFGIQVAYEHACAGDAEAAAKALNEAVPALPNIRSQRQRPQPLPNSRHARTGSEHPQNSQQASQ